jgi:hypothetical protein
MTNNRVLAAAFGVLSVAWILYGFTFGYFVGLPSSMLWTDFTATLLILIFTPAIMLKARWTALGAMIVGVIRIALGILGLFLLPTSLVYGPVGAPLLFNLRGIVPT